MLRSTPEKVSRMENDRFYKMVDETLRDSRETLFKKGIEYNSEKDRLNSFKQSAALQGYTPERALWGMLSKHIISLQDMAFGIEESLPSDALLQEKIRDFINYGLLLKGLIVERKEKAKKGIGDIKVTVKLDFSGYEEAMKKLKKYPLPRCRCVPELVSYPEGYNKATWQSSPRYGKTAYLEDAMNKALYQYGRDIYGRPKVGYYKVGDLPELPDEISKALRGLGMYGYMTKSYNEKR
jgi:hypothetical protein